MEVAVYDSGPPLHVGQEPAAVGLGTMTAMVAGWIDDLQPDEALGMETWIESIRPLITTSPYGNYVIHPAWVERLDEETKRRIGIRFSCVGLVDRCYSEGASIRLFVDEALFPEATRDFLLETWANANPRYLPTLGIEGDGPWRVLLPGYLFHALAQANPRNPYAPTLEDASFP